MEEEDDAHEDDRPGRIQKRGKEAAADESAQILNVAQGLYAHLLAQRHVLDQRGHHRGAKGGLKPGAKAAGQPLAQRIEGQEEQKAQTRPDGQRDQRGHIARGHHMRKQLRHVKRGGQDQRVHEQAGQEDCKYQAALALKNRMNAHQTPLHESGAGPGEIAPFRQGGPGPAVSRGRAILCLRVQTITMSMAS